MGLTTDRWGYVAMGKTPIVQVSGRKAMATMRRQIRSYERRYELSTAQLREALGRGEIRETAEVSKWLQLHQALEVMLNETDTDGTHMRTSSMSTRPS